MAGKKENINFNLATKANTPTRFRCKVGGEWKSIDEFSKNQQRLVASSLTGGYRVNAANSGMTCREHSAGQRTELTCELCGLVKPLSAFSGNTKRNGSISCKRCTAWVETQEPEVVPAPLETGHISIEEERGEAWPARFIDSSDFFSDDAYPQAPVTGYSSLGLEDGEVASIMDGSVPSEYAASETSSSRALPPHLRGAIGQDRHSVASSTDGRNTSSKASFVQHLPPHLRPLVQQSLSLDAASDASSEYGGNPSSISTATTAREARLEKKARRVSFNAWDPSGNQFRGFKSNTDSSAVGTSEADEEEEEDTCPTPSSQARGKWPKIVRMSQTELRQVGTNHHVAARDPGPVNHRPVQFDTTKCCEPDDEDGEDY